MLDLNTQRYIHELYSQGNYTQIINILDLEILGQNIQQFYTQHSLFLLDILPGIATNKLLFDRAIKHLSHLKINMPITRSSWITRFRSIFTENTNNADNIQHRNAVEYLLSSSENFSCRLGLDILKTKSFPIDFLIEQLEKAKLKQPNKVLALLVQYAPQISSQGFFSVAMQELIHVVVTKGYGGVQRINDQYLEDYVNQVTIMAQMLLDVTPKNHLITTLEYCRKLLNHQNGAQIFAIKFLIKLEEINPGIVIQFFAPSLLAKFEILFVLDKSGEVEGMSLLGFNLLDHFINDADTLRLINLAVFELGDPELSAFIETLKTYPGVTDNVLMWAKAWESIVLKNQSSAVESQPNVKRIKLQTEGDKTYPASFPSREIFNQNNNQLQLPSLASNNNQTSVSTTSMPTMQKK